MQQDNNQSQRWLYGLSAPMVAINRHLDASYTSPQFYLDDETVDLSASWQIGNRDDLLALVIRMADNGHAEGVSEAYFLFSRFLPTRWRAYVEQQTPRQQAILSYVALTGAQCGDGGIRAWDLARMSFLCRLGVLNGWITEQESLWLHNRLAQRARHYYASWANYYAAFIVGRCYWLTLGEENVEMLRIGLTQKGDEKVNQRLTGYLYTDDMSPINSLIWYVPLDEFEKPASLQGVDWE